MFLNSIRPETKFKKWALDVGEINKNKQYNNL